MGTHPIFESDFDCLTEQVGSNMSEEFDFTKKKKKSKKMPIEIDGEDNREALDEQANEDLFGQEAVDPAKLDDDLDLTKKKKKKKKKGELDLEDDGENDMAGEFDELSLDKKKKKKKNVDFTEAADEVEVDETKPESERPWLDRDLDKEGYLYKELARIGTKKDLFHEFCANSKVIESKVRTFNDVYFRRIGNNGKPGCRWTTHSQGKVSIESDGKGAEAVLQRLCPMQNVQVVRDDTRQARQTLLHSL